MKKISKFLLYFTIILSLYACGGVIGNIQQYDYNVSTPELKQAIVIAFQNHPEWIPPDDNRYKLAGKYFNEHYKEYFIYLNQPKTIILNFTILFPDSTQNPSTISLSTGANYGDILRLESKLSSDDRKLYKKLFEENFLKELNKVLGQKKK